MPSRRALLTACTVTPAAAAISFNLPWGSKRVSRFGFFVAICFTFGLLLVYTSKL
ncbi:MAG: twin-arginine translocation signal domain-containing protein [Janthinobacterium lividum]